MDRPHLSNHPLFLAPSGRWTADGWYVEQGGIPIPCGGTLILGEDEQGWAMELDLHLMLVGQQNLSVNIVTEFEPWDEGDLDTLWAADMTAVGGLVGRMSVVGDAILSSGVSADGSVSLQECFLWAEDDTYELRGLLTQQGEVMGRWTLTLENEDDSSLS
ncbi:hypothetical protein [Insolitispirillum peregrinum]|uniref:THAP4-like heme-binding beta-barrel domain-containing protein n=1 Tax=Insolitispirillum peregrinum TaxID=80876 RepID=A0A1N7K3R2_9PROT|nr:hypothetical protein [Insolitispirillum peregrinum]SIS56084.1 hypothetical protein SAMN05421779_102588 [Insolitispirillum peregrinum]